MEKFETIIASDLPVLVDFYAQWCGPCRSMHPVLEELKQIVGQRARVVTIDIDDHRNRSIIAQYNIRSVPTFIIFCRGEQMWRQSGIVPLDHLQSLLAKYAEREIAQK